MQVSTAIRDARNNVIESTIGTSATLEARTGVPPANCAAVDTGTLLATITLPSDWLANSSAGVKGIAGTWTTTGSANGFAGHFRIKAGGTCHLQGVCAQGWVASTAFSVGQHVSNGGLTYRCTTAGTSASSGGPSGTGGSITDGTAVWAYVGPTDLLLDNTAIATGQPFSISAFTVTDPNG